MNNRTLCPVCKSKLDSSPGIFNTNPTCQLFHSAPQAAQIAYDVMGGDHPDWQVYVAGGRYYCVPRDGLDMSVEDVLNAIHPSIWGEEYRDGQELTKAQRMRLVFLDDQVAAMLEELGEIGC